MRGNPKQVGRALGDWLRRHRGERGATVDPSRHAVTKEPPTTESRAARVRRLFPTTRMTPYQLRRNWQW